MMWVPLALLSAFSVATVDALCKRGLETASIWLLLWIRFLFAVPFLLAAFVATDIPPLDAVFWLAVALMLPLEVLAAFLYMKALQVSPLSLSLPFLSLTPVFLIATGFLTLGEIPRPMGLAGILLVATGAYALHLHLARQGPLSPVRAIFRERGSLLMMTVAFLYSLTSALGKLAILHSSPFFFGILYHTTLAAAFTGFVLFFEPRPLRKVLGSGSLPVFLLIGLFETVMVFSHVLAISMTQATYMIAVKRTSLLFGIAYGYFLFREARLLERFWGAALMLAGAVLVILS